MKKKTVSQLTEFDVHAFTNIVQETVTKSERRLEKGLKSYIDEKLEKQSQQLIKQMDKKTDKLKKYIDDQTKDLAIIISDNNTVIDKIYARRDEFKKHTSNIRAHQS